MFGSARAVQAGPADVVAAHVLCEEGTCLFAVTVRHADEGTDHYADRFEIRTSEGELLGTRVLAHPHVHEQPFTRRLPGVAIEGPVARVEIRAHDSRHGYGGQTVTLEVPSDGEVQFSAQPSAAASEPAP